MDGEKYLIKVIKMNPVIWNKKLYDYSDNELKNITWLKIAKKFNMDVAFLRKRWCHLRERFVKDLRLVSTGQIKKSKYKHFNDMMFLAEFIKFREKSSFVYNDVNKQGATSEIEDDQSFEDISYLDPSNDELNDDFKIYKSPEKLIEFDELMKIETDDTDPETLFIELPESCDEKEFLEQKEATLIQQPSPTFKEEAVNVKFEKNNVFIDEPSCSKNCGDNRRDEDVIFGELVTSILSKMENEEKRKMKKAIMNILL